MMQRKGTTINFSNSYIHLSNAYISQGEYDIAFDYILKSIQISTILLTKNDYYEKI